MSEVLSSTRYITGKSIVRDLCIREKDFIQSNRLWYTSVLRDAFNKLGIKTQMITKRVALPVNRETVPYVDAPSDCLYSLSISCENARGKLETMVINTKIPTGIADLSLAKQCGCGKCGCKGGLCSSLRNFEDIVGTMDAQMPDGSIKAFKTLYRKILFSDGAYVEQKTLPAKKFVNNIHTDTILETTETFLCNLELEECGCVKEHTDNHDKVAAHCNAVDYRQECGCGTGSSHVQVNSHNMEEDGSRIYLSSELRQDYIVLRYFANSKTKDIVVPFFAKEVMMSAIKEITTNFDPKSPVGEKLYWANDFKKKHDLFLEDLHPVTLTNFYNRMFPNNRDQKCR